MSAISGTGVLALWLDVAPEQDRETNHWYIDEHIPERVDIGGYRRGRRYQAVEGRPQYLTMFEAETPAALASQGYLSVVGKISEQYRRLRPGLLNVARNTFQVRQSRGRGIGAIMASVRLTPRNAAAAEQSAATIDTAVSDLLRRAGIVGVHWLQADSSIRRKMDATRVVGQEDGWVDYALLIEATRAADIDALRKDAITTEALEKAGFIEQNFAVYGLLYEMSTLVPEYEVKLGDRLPVSAC